MAIIGESSRFRLPDELCWVPIAPPVSLEVSLLAHRFKRSPAVARLLEAASEVGHELGWI